MQSARAGWRAAVGAAALDDLQSTLLMGYMLMGPAEQYARRSPLNQKWCRNAFKFATARSDKQNGFSFLTYAYPV